MTDDNDLGPHEYTVWKSTLDDRWQCRVISDDRAPYIGRLTVRELVTAELLLDDRVNIAFAARFGPDAHDVAEWARRCEDIVDAYTLDHPRVTLDPWHDHNGED